MTETPPGRDGSTSATTDRDAEWIPGAPRGPRQPRPRPMQIGNGAAADALGALLLVLAVVLVMAIGFGLYH